MPCRNKEKVKKRKTAVQTKSDKLSQSGVNLYNSRTINTTNIPSLMRTSTQSKDTSETKRIFKEIPATIIWIK